jgi:hypothetical protein
MQQTTAQMKPRCSGRQRATTPKRRQRGRARCMRVDARPELRAEPDWDRFAWALLQYVRTQREGAAPPPSHGKESGR